MRPSQGACDTLRTRAETSAVAFPEARSGSESSQIRSMNVDGDTSRWPLRALWADLNHGHSSDGSAIRYLHGDPSAVTAITVGFAATPPAVMATGTWHPKAIP